MKPISNRSHPPLRHVRGRPHSSSAGQPAHRKAVVVRPALESELDSSASHAESHGVEVVGPALLREGRVRIAEADGIVLGVIRVSTDASLGRAVDIIDGFVVHPRHAHMALLFRCLERVAAEALIGRRERLVAQHPRDPFLPHLETLGFRRDRWLGSEAWALPLGPELEVLGGPLSEAMGRVRSVLSDLQ